MLSVAQYQALKANIAAAPDLAALPHTTDGAYATADLYNAPAVPAFTVWKSSVPIGQIGDKINATELAGLTTLNTNRLQAIAVYAPAGINPSLADRRQAFDDIFSGAGGTITRPALLALWKRPASRVEKLFATGPGTDVAPATLGFEGSLSYQDIVAAWNA